jgi:DNA-binding transcriptional MerR regulator
MTPKLYKAADVCEMAQLQPYVLRSWEKEFPGIGVRKSADSAPLYRQSDIDQVLRIKQLVFGEGLTLAGARRRLETAAPVAATPAAARAQETAEVLETLGADARARIAHVRSGLRLLLDALSHEPGAVAIASTSGNGHRHDDYELQPPPAPKSRAKPAPVKARAVAARTKSARVAAKPAARPGTKAGKRKRASA